MNGRDLRGPTRAQVFGDMRVVGKPEHAPVYGKSYVVCRYGHVSNRVQAAA